jgi:hypothetical protein
VSYLPTYPKEAHIILDISMKLDYLMDHGGVVNGLHEHFCAGVMTKYQPIQTKEAHTFLARLLVRILLSTTMHLTSLAGSSPEGLSPIPCCTRGHAKMI